MKVKEMVLTGDAVETQETAASVKTYIFNNHGLYVTKMGAHPLSLAKERFVVLNDVLHGRKPGQTLYPDEIINRVPYLMDSKDGESLVEALCALTERDYAADIEELGLNDHAQVIARYLHTSDYCFLVKDGDVLTIEHINQYKEGEVPQDLIANVIARFFDRVDILEEYDKLQIDDGVLSVSHNLYGDLGAIIWKGYERYRKGLPKMRRKSIEMLQKYASVHDPANMTAKQFEQALRTIVLAGRNPKVWLELFVDSPDFGSMFSKFGACLIWFNCRKKAASILLDDKDSKRMYEAAIPLNSLRDMLDMSCDILCHAYVDKRGAIALNNVRRIEADDVSTDNMDDEMYE